MNMDASENETSETVIKRLNISVLGERLSAIVSILIH